MEADVPLGAFLSGGIDSSLIVTMMQKHSSKPINTFTIGFDTDDFNEASYSKEIADYLGTNHTELYLSQSDALDVVPNLSSIWDEPFADPSQIPTLLLSSLTRKHVTVALSGDGGDEIFCGYNRYCKGFNLFKLLKKIPKQLVPLVRKSLRYIPVEFLEKNRYLTPKLKYQSLEEKLFKISDLFDYENKNDFYLGCASLFREPESFLLEGNQPQTILSDPNKWPENKSFIELMMYLDSITYLPDDILTKVDRATMSVGLEARVPLLDHTLIEWCSNIPIEVKYKNGIPKWPLRQVLAKSIPEEYFDRPKMGFGVPLDLWLRGSLKEWVADLLNEGLLEKQGIFNSKSVCKMFEEHYSGTRNWSNNIWALTMFQSWYQDIKN